MVAIKVGWTIKGSSKTGSEEFNIESLTIDALCKAVKQHFSQSGLVMPPNPQVIYYSKTGDRTVVQADKDLSPEEKLWLDNVEVLTAEAAQAAAEAEAAAKAKAAADANAAAEAKAAAKAKAELETKAAAEAKARAEAEVAAKAQAEADAKAELKAAAEAKAKADAAKAASDAAFLKSAVEAKDAAQAKWVSSWFLSMSDASRASVVHRKAAAESVLDIQDDKAPRPRAPSSRKNVFAYIGLLLVLVILVINFSKIQSTFG